MARFEWDVRKAVANLRRHSVSFEAATAVFTDAYAIERIDDRSAVYAEERYLITGMAAGVLVAVVYTERSDNIRLISARRATHAEHDDYYRQNSGS